MTHQPTWCFFGPLLKDQGYFLKINFIIVKSTTYGGGGEERRGRTKYSRDLGQYHSRSRRHIRSLSHVAPFLSSPIRIYPILLLNLQGNGRHSRRRGQEIGTPLGPQWIHPSLDDVGSKAQSMPRISFVRSSPNLLHHRETGKMFQLGFLPSFLPASPVNDLQIGF